MGTLPTRWLKPTATDTRVATDKDVKQQIIVIQGVTKRCHSSYIKGKSKEIYHKPGFIHSNKQPSTEYAVLFNNDEPTAKTCFRYFVQIYSFIIS